MFRKEMTHGMSYAMYRDRLVLDKAAAVIHREMASGKIPENTTLLLAGRTS
jgi:hypothetical protein